jgi:ubiquinol-cytochrome c reductase cytochrome c1 subunit
MPNVMWELQGDRRPVYKEVEEHGHKAQVLAGFEQVTPGTMTPLQFDQAVGDMVNYMQWMAEPAQNTRVRVGVWVLLFLLVGVVFTWRLNAAYWKNVK